MPRSAKLEKRLEEMLSIKEYSSGRHFHPVRHENKKNELIKLDANENLFLPQSVFSQIFSELETHLDPRLYPQTEKIELINAISEYIDLPTRCITIGNGSDELIETVIRTFMRKSERCVSVSPTFVMYSIIVEANGYKYDYVRLQQDFSLDANTLISKITSKTVLIILCSPNNPTGNQFEPSIIRKIAEEFEGILVVDEAYVEFAPLSLKKWVEELDNLIILRTFSKAFGLAGLRIGYALASPKITSGLRRIQLPYHVNTFSIMMASKMLQKRNVVFDAIERVKIERERLIKRLNGISGIRAFKSDTNFILVNTGKHTETILNEFQYKQILVRNIGTIPDIGECMRITVGPREKNDQLIEALEEICHG